MDNQEFTFRVHKPKKDWAYFKKNYAGIVYCIPVILGILLFTVVPLVASFVFSLGEYNTQRLTNQYTFLGLKNYIDMFTTYGKETWHSLRLTFRYALITVPISLVGSYLLALFLNQKLKGMKVIQVVFYASCLIPAIASTLLWKDILRENGGFINLMMIKLGLPTFTFYDKVETVWPTIIFCLLWGFPGGMTMWLAQLQSIPQELYESARIDGASKFRQLFKITIPMSTPMIFYQLLVSMIGSLQVFGGYYALRNGVNDSEIDFFVVKIFINFESQKLSYACALSWVLFLIIGVLTVIVFKTSKWVYYGEEK